MHINSKQFFGVIFFSNLHIFIVYLGCKIVFRGWLVVGFVGRKLPNGLH